MHLPSFALFRYPLVFVAFLLMAQGVFAQVHFPVITLSAGLFRIQAEVASTFNQRAQGLMFRQSMPAQAGMLFVFDEKDTHCMWMKNTLIPLSVAFLDDDGHIVNIHDMQPGSLDNHCAEKPVRYALEMNRGWFSEKGIEGGARIRGLDQAPAPR
jgi:uncharacterized protein